MDDEDRFRLNRAWWDERVGVHMGGELYDVGGPDAETSHRQSLTWHHGLGDVISSLAQAGLRIEFLHEHPYALRARWPFLERRPDRTYHMPPDRPQVPLLYSVKATRPSPSKNT